MIEQHLITEIFNSAGFDSVSFTRGFDGTHEKRSILGVVIKNDIRLLSFSYYKCCLHISSIIPFRKSYSFSLYNADSIEAIKTACSEILKR